MNTSNFSPGNDTIVFFAEPQASYNARFPFGDVFMYSAVCPGKESPNEDAAGVLTLEDTGILIVADGLGGSPLGSKAAELVIQNILTCVYRMPDERDDNRVAILDGIEKANKAIINLKVGAGSTCAVIEVSRGKLRSFHIGDSSILVVGQRGKIKFQSIAHSPVGYALEAGNLDEKEALDHDQLHIISNFVGSDRMRIDIGPKMRLRPRDTVLIGSDGVFDNLYTDEIIELVRTGPLDGAGNRLVAVINQRMENPQNSKPSKRDDATFILFRQVR